MNDEPSRAVVGSAGALAAELATALREKPGMELRVWLMLAQRREEAAMSAHVPWLGRDGDADGAGDATMELVTRVLRQIWAHETTHTALLTRWREALESAPDAAAFTGELEGWMMAQCMAGKLGSVTSWLKSAMVGNFEAAAPSATLADRWLQCEATERLAEVGYARILELITTLGNGRVAAELGSDFHGLTAPMISADLPRLIAEERFHGDLFAALRSWLSPGGLTFVAHLHVDVVVERVHLLATRYGNAIGDAGLTQVLGARAQVSSSRRS